MGAQMDKQVANKASDVGGDALPVEYPKNAAKSTSGQSADTTKKEN